MKWDSLMKKMKKLSSKANEGFSECEFSKTLAFVTSFCFRGALKMRTPPHRLNSTIGKPLS